MTQQKEAADYIEPLHINRLNGRMLRAPATAKRQREILLIYGHHGMLERWWGLVQNLQRYGTVTMPDLPGFGGMDSFYKIGRKPTIDAYADYLAAFVTMQYRRRRVTIMGISYGFVVVTRMLQRYPELVKKVDLVVSIVGFMHYDDFLYSTSRRKLYSNLSFLLSTRPLALVTQYAVLNRHIIKFFYHTFSIGRLRLGTMSDEDFMKHIEFDANLWQTNDLRTHWRTTGEFLLVDNCESPIDLPVWHVASKGDHYFDNAIVEQHMRVVYKDYMRADMHTETHTPSFIATKKEFAVMLPAALRKALSKK